MIEFRDSDLSRREEKIPLVPTCYTGSYMWVCTVIVFTFNTSDIREQEPAQAPQAQNVNKLFNSDTVTQRTIYRDCMGNLPLC